MAALRQIAFYLLASARGNERVYRISGIPVATIKPLTKMARQIVNAASIPRLVPDTFRTATEERRGPVYLELPKDIAGDTLASVPASSQPSEGPYRIHFYEHYGHSPAWLLVPQAVTYFEENGFAFRPYLPPEFADSCVAAIDEDGKAIGGEGKEPTESAVAQSRCRSFEEKRMPEYLVEPFDTGPEGLESMQVFINEKAAAGYAFAQAVPREDYHWVLFFKR
ncbi:hypothetical protein [Sinorhizobium meliloti]|uniref:hypothetical protein n=1 Tax=Rhizobium meliloti TaxID=382 RepID=UPI00040CAC0C